MACKSKTKVYENWANMKNRCYNKKNKDYYNYGGRGIVVCDEWLSNSDNFINWAYQNGYED